VGNRKIPRNAAKAKGRKEEKRGRYLIMDELTITKMKVLREAGMSYREIGVKIGVHKNTVMRHLCISTQAKHRESVKKYQELNRVIVNASSKKYYENNKEKVNERRREYGRQYQKRYRLENSEHIKEYNFKYRQNNPEYNSEYNKEYRIYRSEHLKDLAKKYYFENKERIKAAVKQYRLKNKEKTKVSKVISYNRREAIKKSLEHTFTKKEWLACLNYFNNKCAYCGSESSMLQQDHVIPVSKNGPYVLDNIVPACGSCNSSKNNKLISDWYPHQEFYKKENEDRIYQYLSNCSAEKRASNVQLNLFGQLEGAL
jgi:5-methylcytosine-specific restriction endonuclease McrA